MNLNEAIKARDKYLQEHPNMQEFQNTLDEILDRVPEKMRLEVVTMMMSGKMTELANKMRELKDVLPKESVSED